MAKRQKAQRRNVATPVDADYARHVYHIYAVRVPKRDGLRRFLEARGIGCGVHYPIPIHLQEACRNLGYSEGAFAIAEKLAKEFLSLPMFPELTEKQIECVAQRVTEAAGLEALD